jgi:hypothetical protein
MNAIKREGFQNLIGGKNKLCQLCQLCQFCREFHGAAARKNKVCQLCQRCPWCQFYLLGWHPRGLNGIFDFGFWILDF